MNATIFVSVASYRDADCNKTLDSLFSNAANPERIHIGICEQNKSGEANEKCLATNTTKYACNIKTINVDYTDAKGPTWARYLCSTLYNGEDYFMQIDSHVLLVKDWDTKCISAMTAIKEKTGSVHPLLSHYTRTLEDHSKPNDSNEVPRMCQSFFNNRGMLSFLGSQAMKAEPGKFEKNPYIAAGFIFTDGSFVYDVPFDPYLDFIFVGEEILLSARAFTNGYDTYSLPEDIAFHYYTRENSPKIWTDKSYSDEQAHDKIKVIMKLKPGDPSKYGRYGMGTKRTIEEFYDFAGIDIKNKKILKNFCSGTIDPYSESESESGSESGSEYNWRLLLIILILSTLFAITFYL